jgi:hypothetical protein
VQGWRCKLVRQEALHMHHQVFSIHFRNIHSDWSCKCTPNTANAFEIDITLPGHYVSLATATLCQLQLYTVSGSSASKVTWSLLYLPISIIPMYLHHLHFFYTYCHLASLNELGLDGQGAVIWFLAEAKDFHLLQNVHIVSGAHPVSYSKGITGSFPRRKADHTPPSIVWNSWSYTSTSHVPYSKQRDSFTFTFTLLE